MTPKRHRRLLRTCLAAVCGLIWSGSVTAQSDDVAVAVIFGKLSCDFQAGTQESDACYDANAVLGDKFAPDLVKALKSRGDLAEAQVYLHPQSFTTAGSTAQEIFNALVSRRIDILVRLELSSSFSSAQAALGGTTQPTRRHTITADIRDVSSLVADDNVLNDAAYGSSVGKIADYSFNERGRDALLDLVPVSVNYASPGLFGELTTAIMCVELEDQTTGSTDDARRFWSRFAKRVTGYLPREWNEGEEFDPFARQHELQDAKFLHPRRNEHVECDQPIMVKRWGDYIQWVHYGVGITIRMKDADNAEVEVEVMNDKAPPGRSIHLVEGIYTLDLTKTSIREGLQTLTDCLAKQFENDEGHCVLASAGAGQEPGR